MRKIFGFLLILALCAGILTQPALAAFVSGAVNVKSYGATGNGVVNDTDAIQLALNTGKNVFIPSGKYMIDASVSLFPKSNQVITIDPDAQLISIPKLSGNTGIFRIAYVNNVTIVGGQLIGERYNHLGTTGENGHGITIGYCASEININSMSMKNFWGDGIYIGGGTISEQAHNITIDNVVCDNNRRQGMSITHAYNVTVNNSIFSNTNGTDPQTGIQVEPNPGNRISSLTFNNVQCFGNANRGIYLDGYSSILKDITINGGSFRDNGTAGVQIVGVDNLKISDASVSGNEYGIEIISNTTNAEFSGLSVFDNDRSGLLVCVWNQKIGVGNITFKQSEFYNNSQMKSNNQDGVSFYGSIGYLGNINFVQCSFFDNQIVKTQRYGLFVSINDKTKKIIVDQCKFNDNITGGYYGEQTLVTAS